MKKKIVLYLAFAISLIGGILLILLEEKWNVNSAAGISLYLVMLVAGILLLVKGADWFVDSSSAIAKIMKVSALVIGLTVVSFGTSAPELAVSTAASIKANIHHTSADIALGNVVGSNIANLVLVLGLSVAITPFIFKRGILKKEFPFLILTQFILAFFAFDNFLLHGRLTGSVTNKISRGEALVLVLLVFMFIYILVYGVKHPAAEDVEELKREEEEAEANIEIKPIPQIIIFLIVGLVGIVLGGVMISNSAEYLAIKLATAAGADKSNATVLVGLTVVAVGTSLPELLTSCIAAKRGENEIALGNVIGSNIFNTLAILGVAGSICELGINKNILIDMIIMIAITFLVFIFASIKKTSDGKGQFKRWMGIAMVSIYILYIVYIVLRTLVF